MDLMTLVARLTLDSSEYESGLSGAASTAKSMGSKIAGGIGTVAKVGAAAFTAATAAVGALTKAAVDGYAEYEQLVGGVETLFKDSASTVMQYADVAYKTAGLSANEYMSTVTSFSASLLQSLGGDTAEAAKVADRAIIDMSDNANKMGTSMESIQNAYRGFAKQNFTMLDNLSLGYGGTKSEMERLIADASKMTDIQNELNVSVKEGDTSFANIVNAISVMQKSLGITGTTAKEASTTITGSINAMKGAWDNLIVGLARGDSDFSGLIQQLVDSASTVFQNIIPIAQQALVGIASFIEQIIPVITQKLPELIDSTLPKILEAAGTVVVALVKSIPGAAMSIFQAIYSTLSNNLPDLISNLSDSMSEVGGSLIEQIPEYALNMVTAFTTTITNNIGKIVESAKQMMLSFLNAVMEVLPQMITAGVGAIAELARGIGQALPDLIPAAVDAVMTLAETVIDNLPTIIEAATELIIGFASGLVAAIPRIIERIPEIISKLVSAILSSDVKIIDAGTKLLSSLVSDLPSIIVNIVSKIPEIVGAIVSAFGDAVPDMIEAGANLMLGFAQGLVNGVGKAIDAAKNAGANVLKAIDNFFDMNSPSKVLEHRGKFLDEGLAIGIDKNTGLVDKAVDKLNASADNINGNVDVQSAAVSQRTFEVPRYTAPQYMTTILEVDGVQFGKAVYSVNDRETQRVGVKLVTA